MKEKIIGILIVILLIVVGAAVYKNKKLAVPKDPVSNNNNPVNNPAKTQVIVESKNSKEIGDYLTDANGNTLYVSLEDKDLKSNCNGECAKIWIPFLYDNKDLKSYTDTDSKKINIITREDGSYQYTFGVHPLYYFSGDKKPGDITGNSYDSGKWSIVNPAE